MRPAASTAPTAAGQDSGIVLVTVLWMLALLGGLIMAMSAYTGSAVATIDVYRDRTRAEAAVAGGLALAAARVAVPDAPPRGSGRATIGGVAVAFDYFAETARIDVNAAKAELVAGLFTVLGASSTEAQAFADAIVARRGQDVDAAKAHPAPVPGKPAGYDPDEENPDAPSRLAVKNRAAQAAEQHRGFVDLAQLDGLPIPSGLVARAKPFLTVYSGVPQVDARLAAPEILAALPGMTRERVRTLLDLRKGAPSPEALADVLGSAKSFTTDGAGVATRISVRVRLDGGYAATSEIVIVHYKDDTRPYRVLSWEDDPDGSQRLASSAMP